MAELLSTIRDHLMFVVLWLALFAGLVLAAFFFEKRIMKKRHPLRAVKTISYVAVFSALAGLLMLLEIPLFFAPSFYKIDLSELPVLICTFYLGPVAGVICELLKVILKLLLKGTTTAFVGDFGNFLVGCSLVLPASVLYQVKPTKKGAVAALALGTACLTVFGSLFNAWYLIPKFAELYGIPLKMIVSMGTEINASITDLRTLVLFAVVPFNLLKGVLVSVLTFLLYKRVQRLFFQK